MLNLIKRSVMTIETKYNIGDEVWFMDKNMPTKGVVVKLDVDIARSGDWYIEHYKVEVVGFIYCKIGQHLFPTKEELIKSL